MQSDPSPKRFRELMLDEERELMHETLDEWTAYVHGRIDEFGEDDL